MLLRGHCALLWSKRGIFHICQAECAMGVIIKIFKNGLDFRIPRREISLCGKCDISRTFRLVDMKNTLFAQISAK